MITVSDINDTYGEGTLLSFKEMVCKLLGNEKDPNYIYRSELTVFNNFSAE